MLEADKNAASETNIASMYVLESLFWHFMSLHQVLWHAFV